MIRAFRPVATRVSDGPRCTPCALRAGINSSQPGPSGLLGVARLLIEAGADPTATSGQSMRADGWSPLRCAVAGANTGPSNRAIVELLLEHGVTPNDHDMYLAGFAHDYHQLLPLLLERVPNLRGDRGDGARRSDQQRRCRGSAVAAAGGS